MGQHELVGASRSWWSTTLKSFIRVGWPCFYWKGAQCYEEGLYLEWNKSIILELSEKSH